MVSLPLGVLCFLATVSHAISFGNSSDLFKEDLTSEKFLKVANGIIAYKKYVPAEIVRELNEMIKPENSDEVDELVAYSTTVRGRTNPKFEAIDALRFQMMCPTTHARFTRVFMSMVMKVMSLSEEAKRFITENSKSSEAKTSADHIRNIIGLKKAFGKLPESVQAEYEVRFPAIMRFFATPAYQAFINTLVELNDKSDDELTEGATEAGKKLIEDFQTMEH